LIDVFSRTKEQKKFSVKFLLNYEPKGTWQRAFLEFWLMVVYNARNLQVIYRINI